MLQLGATSSVPLFDQDLFLQSQKPHFKINVDSLFIPICICCVA